MGLEHLIHVISLELPNKVSKSWFGFVEEGE
jgi:hypothetical protein